MKNPSKKISGFTLVELIVVITILVILGTIAFISLGWYAASARDSARIENLANLHKGLSLLQVKSGKYPMPESPVNITASGTIIGYQGFAKEQIGALANISKWGTVDPADASIYTTYSVTADQTKMQLMAFLEEGSNVTYTQKAFAAVGSDYSKRYPTVKGDSLGILLGNTGATRNQPIQETGTGVDVVNTSTEYTAIFSKADSVSGSGDTLVAMKASFTSWSLPSRDSSLVGYWDMETVVSAGRLADLSGKGNHGTNSGSVLIGQASGQKAMGTYFDGINDAFIMGDVFDVWSGSLTVSTWFKTDAMVVNLQKLISKWQSNAGSPGDSGYSIRFILPANCSGYCLAYESTSSGSVVQQSILSGSPWSSGYHQASIVIDRNVWKSLSYLDGKLVGSVGFSPGVDFDTNLSFSIGALVRAPFGITSEYFSGAIDEVRVYNRALPDSEVRALYLGTR